MQRALLGSHNHTLLQLVSKPRRTAASGPSASLLSHPTARSHHADVPPTPPCSERALHLVSYEGVSAAGLDPFLTLLERVMGLPPVPNAGTPTANSQLPSRTVAATAFLKHFVLMRSDEQLVVNFRCVRPWAESLLLPVLPMVCRPFAGWAAALNVREKVAAATTAPGAHRYGRTAAAPLYSRLYCVLDRQNGRLAGAGAAPVLQHLGNDLALCLGRACVLLPMLSR